MDVLIVCYGIIMNLLAFLLYGIDKWSARHDLRRIPEKVLLGIAAIGGSLGAFASMRLFRHKTRKTKSRSKSLPKWLEVHTLTSL